MYIYIYLFCFNLLRFFVCVFMKCRDATQTTVSVYGAAKYVK